MRNKIIGKSIIRSSDDPMQFTLQREEDPLSAFLQKEEEEEAIKMTHQPIENNNNEGRYKKQNSGNINDSNKSKKMRDEISDSE